MATLYLLRIDTRRAAACGRPGLTNSSSSALNVVGYIAASARNTEAAPTQPTDVVPCVVYVSLRRAGGNPMASVYPWLPEPPLNRIVLIALPHVQFTQPCSAHVP